MSWRTASYFSSRPTAATNSSRYWTAIPKHSRDIGDHPHLQRHAQTGPLAQTMREFPQKIARYFCLNDSAPRRLRSEEHTSELQSQSNLVCRLLLEKKKTQISPSQVERLPTTLGARRGDPTNPQSS